MSACVVVGGGIAGALTALELAKAGFQPHVLDAAQPGAATPASAGILFCILDWGRDDAPWTALAHDGAEAYARLQAELDEDIGLETRGLLSVGGEAEDLMQWAARRQRPFEVLTPHDCRRRYPLLAPPEGEVTLLPDVAQVDPRRLMPALRRHLQQQGVRWENAAVTELLTEAERVVGVSDGTREWSAPCVVLAAGAWSSQLLAATDESVDIQPRRGQILSWQRDVGNLPIVLEGSRYLVARASGEVLVGATDEAAGFDIGATAQAQEELLGFARRWCPKLNVGEPDEQRVGLRPKSGEDSPLLGAHSKIRGLYFNTGHYRHGIVCAPAAATQVVGAITKEN